MTTSYSPATKRASTVTPRSRLRFFDDRGAATMSCQLRVVLGLSAPTSGPHGACSQYSTSRGADSESTLSNTSAGSVLTVSFDSTTGTGTTIAKFSGGPLYVLDMVMTVRLPLRISTTCDASLVSFASLPATKKP